MVDKKAYTKDEIYEILESSFKTFVCVGIFDEVTEEGEFETDSTFMARNGNIAACIGLASETVRDLQKKRDAIPWSGEDE